MAYTDHHMSGFPKQESLFLGLTWVHPVWAAASGHSPSSAWEAQRDPATPHGDSVALPPFVDRTYQHFPNPKQRPVGCCSFAYCGSHGLSHMHQHRHAAPPPALQAILP